MTQETKLEMLDWDEEPEYYACVPGCVYHLTYLVTKNGKTTRKRLSPRARDLYGFLLQGYWSSKKCWKNTKNLAAIIGCSTGIIPKLKNELCQEFEQLRGKSLITVEKKQKWYIDKNGINQSIVYDYITIEFIAPENDAFMAENIACTENLKVK